MPLSKFNYVNKSSWSNEVGEGGLPMEDKNG